MGNKLKKLIMFLVVVLGMTLFANEEQKAPNEIIKDNPEREVTTVESMKVRDHATMSLSVTKKNEKVIEGELDGDRLKVKLPVKGINENTLDRMAKPKEGKRLVVEAKSKINPRMAKMATKDIKKMPTQEEMNNLTVEQIQAMMSDTTDKKEEESQSKNIKNHIATENEEGVNLDILGVNKNENIYVNVEENGKVIDRYRVAIINTATPRVLDVPDKIEYKYLIQKIRPIGGKGIWFADKNNVRVSANIQNLKSVEITGDGLTHLSMRDSYLGERKIEFSKQATDAIGAAVQIKVKDNLPSVIYDKYYPLFENDVLGSKSEVYSEFYVNPTVQGMHYATYKNAKNFEAKRLNKAPDGQKVVNAFKRIKFVERYYTTTVGQTGISTYYLANADVTAIGFELAITTKDNLRYPGVYQSVGYLDTLYTTSDGLKKTVRLHYINVDVGDEEIVYGQNISEDGKKKYSKSNLEVATDRFVELSDSQNTQISYMNTGNSNTGLYYYDQINNKFIKLSPGVEQEVIYRQSYGNGQSIDQRIKIKVTQQSGQWAKVSYQATGLRNPNATTNPQVVFEIVQGRNTAGNGAKEVTSLSQLRRAKYTLNFAKVNPSAGSVTMELDPRLQQILGNDKFIGTSGDVVNASIQGNKSYSNMLKLTDGIKTEYKENGVRLNGIEGMTTSETVSTYKYYLEDNIRVIGLKTVSSKLGWYAGSNDLVISAKNDRTFKVKFEGNNGDLYDLDVKVDYVDGINKDGYSGTGTLNMSGAKKNTEYVFNAPSNGSSSISGMTMNVSGTFPNLKGVVSDKKGINIANKVEVSYRNEKKTGNLGDMIAVDTHLKVGLTNTGQIKIEKLTPTFDYTSDNSYHNIILKYKYNDVVLGTFTLKVKSKETDAGSITFQVDPRLKQLVDSKNYITSSKTIGGNNVASHDSNNDYSKMINVATSYTNNSANKSVAGIYYIEGKVAVNKSGTNSGINSNYIGFADNLNVTADIILKNGTGELSYYGSSRDVLISFASTKSLKGKLKHLETGNEEAYNLNFILNYANDVPQEGYSGTGTVNVGAAELNKEYVFSAPVSGTTTTVSGMTMTVSGNFPNTKGIVTNTTTNIADKVLINNQSVSIGSMTKIGEDLEVGLTTDGEIKIKKLKSSFDYSTDNNNIKLEYKYKDVVLGTFILKIKSNEVDGGNITFNIDPRLEQASSSIGTYVTGEKTLGSESLSSHSKVFSELVEVTSIYQNGAGTAKNVSIISIKDKQNVSISTGESYVGFGTSGSAEIILKKNPGALNYYSSDNKDTLISISNPATYKSKIQDSNGKTYNVNFVMSKSDQVNKDGYNGSGTLNLTDAGVGEKYTFAVGKDGNIIGTTTNSTNQNITLKITSGKSLDATGVLTNNSSNRIANRMVVQNGKTSLEIRGKATGDLSQSLTDIGVDIGINEKGELTVTKTGDIEVNSKELSIDYYYDVSDTSIHLGNFKLTVTNERRIIPMGDIEVKVDSRLANISAAEWVRANGFLHDSNGEYGNYSKLISATDNRVSNLDKNEVITIESINDNTNLGDRAGTKATYKYLVNGNNIAVLPYSTSGKPVTLENYGIDNKSLIFISKRDISTNARRTSSQEVTNNFVLEAKATTNNILYSGTIKEIYLGKKDYSGSGNIDLGNSIIDEKYVFGTTTSGGTISSNKSGINITGVMDDPVNSLDIFGDGTNIANKLKVTFTTSGNTRQSKTTTLTSNTLEVTEHNLSVGIDTTDGGLTLTRKGGSDVTKAVITYYYDPEGAGEVSTKAVTLGTFTLNITNANPVTNLGTLRTVIDPRLGNLKNRNGENVANKEWLTLDGYTGTNLETLVNNKYNGLIRKNIDGNLTLATELKKIIKVSKGETQYDKILGGAATYTRFGTKSPEMPYVAIKLINDGSLNTGNLTTSQNFARKVSDTGAVIVEAEGELNQRYSFKHDLAIALIPISGYEKDKGYVGTGRIDLGNTPISENYYILVPEATKSSKNSNSEEEIQLDSSTGTLPNLTGLIKEYRNQVIASKYTVTINGKEGEKKNLGEEVEVVPNQVKIKLDNVTDTRGLKLLKITDDEIKSTTVTIKYYHSSGIQLGEYDLTISNSSKATLNGTITTKVDPRFIQVALENNKYRSHWIASDNKVGANLNDDILKSLNGIVESSFSNVTSGNVNKIIEISNGNNIYMPVSGKVGGYTKYKIRKNNQDQENFAVKLNNTLADNMGTIARKYIDNENGDLTIKYVTVSGATATKKSFTHKLKLVKGPTDNFSDRDGYSGSGTVDLSNKGIGKYRIVKPQKPSPLANSITDLEVENYSGHFPVLTGLVTNNIIATHYSINGKTDYIELGTETEVETDKLKITLDSNGDITLERMGTEKITKNSVTIDYFYFPEKNSTSSTKIKLGSFTLNINDSIFELEPNTQTLDFGTMFYDSRDGKVNHVKRTQKFTLKAHGKEVDFRVADNSEMTITGTNNKIDLIDVKVTKKSNTEFELGATAVLNENTAFGTYNGEIQVIVDITTPSKP